MTERDENDLADEELLQMWKEAESVEVERTPPSETPREERAPSPSRSARPEDPSD